MIVIEGTDNSGKTTLCNRLGIHLQLPVIHSEKPMSIKGGIERVQQMTRHTSAIWDRVCVISEPIYGEICRGLPGGIMGEMNNPMLDYLLAHDPLIIHCQTTWANAGLFGEREQMEGVIDNAPELWMKYRTSFEGIQRLCAKRGVMMAEYDWDRDNYEAVLNLCKMYQSEKIRKLNLVNQILTGEVK